MSRNLTVLDAPSNLGLREPSPDNEPGVRRFPDALRATGFVDRIGADDVGRLDAPPNSYAWNGKTVFNAAEIAAYSLQLADRVGSLIDEAAFPIVVGGDCSILLGPMLALRRRGRYGLAHLDGHLNFRHPGNSPAVGVAAGEDLALVTGRGQDILTNLEGLRPYVRDEDVISIGDTDELEDSAGVLDTAIAVINWPSFEIHGAAKALDAVLHRLNRTDLAGYWIHLDVDILDSTLMPAVDSTHSGGLNWDELTLIARGLLSSDKAVGIEMTIFDPDGRYIAALSDCLVDIFRQSP